MSFALYGNLAQQAAAAYGVDPNVFTRLVQQESGWNPDAVSPAGAVGLAQFMPETAAGLGVDPTDPVSALYGAARHLRDLLDRYGNDYSLALAAYNAGPGAVDAAGGVPQYAETQQYLTAILGDQAPQTSSSRGATVVNQQAGSSSGGIESLLGVALQQLANSQLMGYLNYGLGEAGLTGNLNGSPTLPFMQYQQSVENADRAYQLDLSRYGLQVAEFNFAQRQSVAQQQLQTMGLLSGLRGPSNALAYDYALKGLSAPAGTEANPFAFLQGVNQPKSETPAALPARTGAAAGAPIAQVPKPQTPQLPGVNAPGGGGGFFNPGGDENPWTGWADPGQEEQAALAWDAPGTPGYGVAEALYGAEQAAGGTPNDMGVGGNIQNDDPGSHSVGGYSWEIPSYGRGGASLPFLGAGGSAAIVGDDPEGEPGEGDGDDENEEIAIAPNGPLIVLSRHGKGPFKLDPAFLQGQKRAGRGGSFDDPEVLPADDELPGDAGLRAFYEESLRHPIDPTDTHRFRDEAQLDPSQVHDVRGGMPFMERSKKIAMRVADLARRNQTWVPRLPTMAEGGVQTPLSTTTYSPEQFGQAPFLQQLKTGDQTSGGLYSGKRDIGGTDVPIFNGLNLRNYRNLLPSQQGLYRSFVESPEFMGGLGINFEDNLAAAARHSFSGRGATPAFMGR